MSWGQILFTHVEFLSSSQSQGPILYTSPLEAESLFPESLSSRSCARGLASGLYTEARTGDAAAPVVWWTCAPGRGVPERVRRPRERSEPGATTLTVGGGGLDGHQGKSLLFFGLLYVCLWRQSVK